MKNIRNSNDFNRVVERIHQLSQTSNRQWGKMRVEEMLPHCADQIRLAMGSKQAHEQPTLINASIAKYIGLWLPRIPLKNLRAPVDMNARFFGTAAADIETEKAGLIQLLQQVHAMQAGTVLQPHPMYGKLSLQQWGRFMYVHIDHHLRQFSC